MLLVPSLGSEAYGIWVVLFEISDGEDTYSYEQHILDYESNGKGNTGILLPDKGTVTHPIDIQAEILLLPEDESGQNAKNKNDAVDNFPHFGIFLVVYILALRVDLRM